MSRLNEQSEDRNDLTWQLRVGVSAADDSAPDPYQRELTALADALPPPSPFEAEYAAAQMREVEAMRQSLDGEPPRPARLTAAELSEYAAPDPYEAGLKALREKLR